MSDDPVVTNRDHYLGIYERMLLIRRAEEKLAAECSEGKIPGTVHLYIGQEAVAVGVCSELRDDDWITSTHRGHGHFLAKGGELDRMFAEIWGKSTGICQGMGGSMHVADVSKGIMGANGIVGGGFAIATGAAFSSSLSENGRVAVCFFGDGAANQGVFMESMNISAAWKLPTIFICENNGLSQFTVSSTVTHGELADRARAFMPVEVVDGNDVLAVARATAEALARARRGEGPTYIEAKTYRIRGHLEAEDAFLGGGRYREAADIEPWRTNDPLARFADHLLAQGIADQADLDRIAQSIAGRVEAAAAFADASDEADTELVFDLMFAGATN
jgi:pyruvate dehydrogenase E1 component alpha subunit